MVISVSVSRKPVRTVFPGTLNATVLFKVSANYNVILEMFRGRVLVPALACVNLVIILIMEPFDGLPLALILPGGDAAMKFSHDLNKAFPTRLFGGLPCVVAV